MRDTKEIVGEECSEIPFGRTKRRRYLGKTRVKLPEVKVPSSQHGPQQLRVDRDGLRQQSSKGRLRLGTTELIWTLKSGSFVEEVLHIRFVTDLARGGSVE
jgi:hypothetical protein